MSAPQLLQWLVSYSLQAALVLGVAASLDRWSHAATTKTRVWTACFVSLLGLLAVGLLAPHAQWGNPWSGAPVDTVVSAVRFEQALGPWLIGVWLFGAAVMAVRAVIDLVRVQRFIAKQPAVSEAEDARLRSLVEADQLEPGGKPVEFRVGPEALGPFCYQFHRPLVFVPRSLIDGDDQELHHVLEHELTHLRTEHPLQVFLQKTVQCVLWFHPLVWMASGRANLVREFVCDDAASHNGASTAAYLRTLLRIVENHTRPYSGGLTIGRTVSEVRRRAARLVANHGAAARSPSAAPAALLVVAALAATAVSLPIDPLASPQSRLSPWPTWSAAVLHGLDVPVRDFQTFDARSDLYELSRAVAARQEDR